VSLCVAVRIAVRVAVRIAVRVAVRVTVRVAVRVVASDLACCLQAPADCLSAIYTVLSRRRGHVTQDLVRIS